MIFSCTQENLAEKAKRGVAHRVITDLVAQLELYCTLTIYFPAFPFCKSWKSSQSVLWGQ